MDGEFFEKWIYWYLAILLVIGLIGHFFIYRILKYLVKRFTKGFLDDLIVKHCYRTIQWIVVLLFFRIAAPYAIFEEYKLLMQQITSILFILLSSYLVIKIVYVLERYILSRYDITGKDNLKARKLYTQLNVMRQIVIVLVVLIAIGLSFMVFDRVRQVGTTILASAGIIGIVVGMAAQKTLGSFIAGLQIAFTQPIRLDDVVIVENEWGRIEEITLTYVVVKIWDLRRLIVPITYFIDNPFQNWTRSSSEILGTVYIYVDYEVPTDEVRQKLKEFLEASEHWDKKVSVLQVTNATERSVELRALMSATDASTAWTLRCEIREKLLAYIRDTYPQALPKTRIEFEKLPDDINTSK